ncbi:hypothetical protein DH2020_013058 [Rehmannia glutinosa]|uniref:Dof-type domain-containing protein n=1 Tax=Rehmannia glutinosa TaxID=99300 RepID=A0ABR0X4B0_REHGL
MKELKDPEIKLFGRKIVLPENGGGESSAEYSEESNNGSSGGGDGDCDEGEKADDEKQLQTEEEQVAEIYETKPQEKDQNPNSLQDLDENPKTPSVNEDGVSENNPKTENEQTDTSNGQQKTLKKPDKILPCPRCNSMDTKFCYYNNYNVNQPRHFCKSCQRYWTAGGTMRNVPVGAGRRKNKNSTSHCRHITISEALHASRVDAPNGFHHPAFKPNGTVLSFGPDTPLCESMASALNLADKRAQNGVIRNGENIDDSSTRSSSVPMVPWSFPWNPAVPLPAICPVPFYPPPPYWNYGVPNAWNVPWLSTQSPNSNQSTTTGSNPSSPLGKHSRNGELLSSALRIDDPEEAAKSSIWETLGIKYDSVSREGLLRPCNQKLATKNLKSLPHQYCMLIQQLYLDRFASKRVHKEMHFSRVID